MKAFFNIVFGGLGLILVFVLVGSIWQKVSIKASAQKSKSTQESVKIFNANEEEGNGKVSDFWSLATTSITAKSYIVFDIGSSSVLKEKDSDRLLPLASVVKLITAIVADNLFDKDQKVWVTKSIVNTYGNTAGFADGEVFSASDLMYPLLLVSSNDAAEAFAQSYGRTKFIKAMNDFAYSIGAYSTYIGDPTGLSDKNVSSAKDIALILKWISENKPNILGITLEKNKTVRNHNWINPTHFLSWSYYIGGKNGFTDGANRTGALLFDFGGKKMAVVVLGSKNRDSDVVSLLGKVINN
jgi:D-alanyl-D-alanine carboxypeptidase